MPLPPIKTTLLCLSILTMACTDLVWAQNASTASDEQVSALSAKVYKRVAPATIRIEAGPQKKTGTGTFVGAMQDGTMIILTACHVITSNFEEAKTDPGLRLQFYDQLIGYPTDAGTSFTMTLINELYCDEENDVALIRSTNPLRNRKLMTYTKSSDAAMGILAGSLGFPLSDNLAETVGTLVSREGNYLIFEAVSGPIGPGSSGSALVDGRGRALGMVVSEYTGGENEDQALVLQMDLIAAILLNWMNEFGVIKQHKFEPINFKPLVARPWFIITSSAVLSGGILCATGEICGADNSDLEGAPAPPEINFE